MKRIILMLLVIISIVFTPSTVSAATKTYNISTNKKFTIDEGKKCKLSLPSKYKNIKWSSNNKEVATVSKSGSLTAVNGGKATIIAKSGKKTFKCYITVKEDYSEWIPYDTGDLETLADNIIAGNVVKIDGRYYCSPEYAEMVSNEEIVFEKDISEGIENERNNTLSPDTELTIIDDDDEEDNPAFIMDRINKMSRYGFASSEDLETEIGKAYIKFCDSWVSEYELKNSYNTSVVPSISNDSLYLITGVDNKYIITVSPRKPESGTIYTNGEVQYQYLDKFEHDGQSYDQKQYFFNRADLIKIGVLK